MKKLMIKTPYGMETAIIDDDTPASEIRRIIRIAISTPPGNGRFINKEENICLNS